MKRVLRISDAAAAQLLFNLHMHKSKPTSLIPAPYILQRPSFYRFYEGSVTPTISHSTLPSKVPNIIINSFIEKLSLAESQLRPNLVKMQKLVQLRDELFKVDSLDEVGEILEGRKDWLLGNCRDRGDVLVQTKEIPDCVFLELLSNLGSRPNLAMEVFNWRRRKVEQGYPMTSKEYASGIAIAGRITNVALAAELFSEAESKQLKTTLVYNALMSTYMFNGLIEKCQSVFWNLKRDPSCSPSIVTYNILISVFGRMMLIDHMEATFQEIQHLNLSPNVSTYNNVIAAYLTAWMWDRMELIYLLMKTGPVKPNIDTHLLMLRGYANSGKLDRMEETLQMLKLWAGDHTVHIPLIRVMIAAYCKSSVKDRTKKVEELLRLIPEDEYRAWLNVLLIRLFAQENNLEIMERLINEAFEHKTTVLTVPTMCCITTAYYRRNAVDKLSIFIKLAERAGWRINRSLYHCKMSMYGLQKRLEEMENVLNEMDNVHISHTKKTFLIMYKAYLMCGKRHKVETVVGLMCKRGYQFPMEEFLS